MILELNSSTDDVRSKFKDINNALDNNTVVLIWAVWCPHCVQMKDAWAKYKSSVGSNINIVEIESSNLDKIKQQNNKLFNRLSCKSNRVFFPMIKFWKDKQATDFNEDRTFAKLKKFSNTHYSDTTKSTLVSPKSPRKSKSPSKSRSKSPKKKGGAIPTESTQAILNTNSQKQNAKGLRQIQNELNEYINSLLKRF